jgi:hypothetical protein
MFCDQTTRRLTAEPLYDKRTREKKRYKVKYLFKEYIINLYLINFEKKKYTKELNRFRLSFAGSKLNLNLAILDRVSGVESSGDYVSEFTTQQLGSLISERFSEKQEWLQVTKFQNYPPITV